MPATASPGPTASSSGSSESSRRTASTGRVCETREDRRQAVRAFIARCNAAQPIEKNGHLSPHARRRQHARADTPVASQPDRVSGDRFQFGSKLPFQAIEDWHKLERALFGKQPYYLPGCDT
jgi:hypothetical protein